MTIEIIDDKMPYKGELRRLYMTLWENKQISDTEREQIAKTAYESLTNSHGEDNPYSVEDIFKIFGFWESQKKIDVQEMPTGSLWFDIKETLPDPDEIVLAVRSDFALAPVRYTGDEYGNDAGFVDLMGKFIGVGKILYWRPFSDVVNTPNVVVDKLLLAVQENAVLRERVKNLARFACEVESCLATDKTQEIRDVLGDLLQVEPAFPGYAK